MVKYTKIDCDIIIKENEQFMKKVYVQIVELKLNNYQNNVNI